MRIKSKFLEFLADIFVKIFQIVFASIVVGMFLREKFDGIIFAFGLLTSFAILTIAIILYYNGSVRMEG